MTETLSDDAEAFVKGVQAAYGLGDDDIAAIRLLRTAGTCLDRMWRAQALIERHGELVQGRDGLKMNPACAVEKDARNGFLSVLRLLSLDIEPPRPPGRPPGDFHFGG